MMKRLDFIDKKIEAGGTHTNFFKVQLAKFPFVSEASCSPLGTVPNSKWACTGLQKHEASCQFVCDTGWFKLVA